MIRTHNVPPALRVEWIGQTLRAVSPKTNESITLSTSVDGERVQGIQLLLWRSFNAIREGYAVDGPFSTSLGGEAARKLYQTGLSALMRLIGSENADQSPAIQQFFDRHIPKQTPADELPPILDLISDHKQHLPLEGIPLFGTISNVSDARAILTEIRQVLPAYRTVLRRIAPAEHGSTGTVRNEEGPIGVSVRFFKHHHLVGALHEVRELTELQSRGVISLALVFPGRGHKPSPRDWPELELAKHLGVRPAEAGENQKAARPFVCHFSCHLRQKQEDSILEMRSESAWRAVAYSLEGLRGARAQIGAPGQRPSIVFLNTCRSGVEDQRARTSAVDVFRYYSPDCVIGTLADIPSLAAADFCIAFYRAVGAGSSAGVAIRIARLALLSPPINNPFGLLYTSYFGEDVHVRTRRDQIRSIMPVNEPQ